jgi:hypothetical protein
MNSSNPVAPTKGAVCWKVGRGRNACRPSHPIVRVGARGDERGLAVVGPAGDRVQVAVVEVGEVGPLLDRRHVVDRESLLGLRHPFQDIIVIARLPALRVGHGKNVAGGVIDVRRQAAIITNRRTAWRLDQQDSPLPSYRNTRSNPDAGPHLG